MIPSSFPQKSQFASEKLEALKCIYVVSTRKRWIRRRSASKRGCLAAKSSRPHARRRRQEGYQSESINLGRYSEERRDVYRSESGSSAAKGAPGIIGGLAGLHQREGGARGGGGNGRASNGEARGADGPPLTRLAGPMMPRRSQEACLAAAPRCAAPCFTPSPSRDFVGVRLYSGSVCDRWGNRRDHRIPLFIYINLD